MALPDDIITKVRQDFSEDDSLRALQTLKELVKEDAKLFSNRILRCLVVLAACRTDELAKAIELTRIDWRDTISAAEYDWGNRVRLLQLPFGFHPDFEIFKQWLVGQVILIPWMDNQSWTVEHSDIRSLSLEQVRQLNEVSEKVSDPNLYFACLSFLCIRGEKEIRASNAIEGKFSFYYRLNPEQKKFEFQKFICDPKKLGKRGKW
jgi:hypothetical protein